jgi:hypothetical protein
MRSVLARMACAVRLDRTSCIDTCGGRWVCMWPSTLRPFKSIRPVHSHMELFACLAIASDASGIGDSASKAGGPADGPSGAVLSHLAGASGRHGCCERKLPFEHISHELSWVHRSFYEAARCIMCMGGSSV